VVLSRTAKGQVLTMIGLLVWPGLIAPVIAPLAGGVITTYASWHWLFGVNVPLGILAFVVAWRLIDSPHTDEVAPPLDALGGVLTCGGLAAATYMAYLLSQSRVPWSGVAACAVVALLALGGAAAHLLHVPHPLVNLRTLRVPTFRAALSSGTLFWTAITAVPFVLTLLFQDAFGWSPVKSGALVVFVFIGNITIKPTTTPLLRRFGFRPVLVASTAGAAATMAAAAFIRADTPLVLIAAIGVLNGFGRSVSLTCYSTIAFSDTPPEQIRDANTLQATAQQLAVGLGVPLGAVAIRAGGPLASALPGAAGAAEPYSVAFVLLALVALVATAAALRLHPDAGSAVTRRPGAAPAASHPS
jgi:MFS family permease